MRALFNALLRFYEFDGPPSAKTAKRPSQSERHVLDGAARDASTFPYLP